MKKRNATKKAAKPAKNETVTGSIPSFVGGHKVGCGYVPEDEPVTNTGKIPAFIGSGRVN